MCAMLSCAEKMGYIKQRKEDDESDKQEAMIGSVETKDKWSIKADYHMKSKLKSSRITMK